MKNQHNYLSYFDNLEKNPTKFPSQKVDVVEGFSVGSTEKCAILKFKAMVEVSQVPLKKQKILFLSKTSHLIIIVICSLYLSFLSSYSEELLNCSSNCLNFVATMKSQGAILDAPT